MKRLVLLLSLMLFLPLVGATAAQAPAQQSAASKVEQEPRGIRNSNPGNIRSRDGNSVGRWKNATGVDDKGYLTFRRDVDGIRALIINLKVYHKRYKINTVDRIIRRWCNDVDEAGKVSYIKFVSGRLDVGPNTKLNMEDPQVLLSIARAIVHFENGKDPYSQRTYDKVLKKVKGERP